MNQNAQVVNDLGIGPLVGEQVELESKSPLRCRIIARWFGSVNFSTAAPALELAQSFAARRRGVVATLSHSTAQRYDTEVICCENIPICHEVSVSVMPTFDPALLDLFRAELETHLPALSEGLLALEKDADQPERLEALMRAAHSVKGAAKIVGVEAAVQVAHALEDCFVAAQKGTLTLGSDAVDVLLRGVDALHRVVPTADDSGDGGLPEASLRQLLDDVAAVRAGRTTPRPPSPAPKPVRAGPPTLKAAGDLDAATAETLRNELLSLLAQGVTQIRFDFAAVRDVAPAGLLLLTSAARRANAVRYEVVNAAPEVQELLRLTRLDDAFPLGGVGT
jgi:anti-anti-sigma factor